MKRTRSFLLSAIGALAMASYAGAEGPTDAFVADFTHTYEKRDNIPTEVKTAALNSLQSKPSAEMVSRALRKFYPDLNAAMTEGDAEKSLEMLKKLTESGDPFLSAEAHYAIGRRLFADLKHEDALTLFQKVAAELASHSLRAGEAHYYLAVCQEKMLQKQEAITTFETMIAFFGDDVSKRLLDDATSRTAQLQKDVDGSLGDVANHMEFSERKLSLTDSGERTQQVQEHIVAMLDDLIEQAENSPP